VHVDAERRIIEATACRPIAEGDPLGSWYFQDTGLWWMGTDVRRAIFETERGFVCGCKRCQGQDMCRAMPCEVCVKGRTAPVGSQWRCTSCGHSSAGDALRLASEAELVPRVLVELRPPKTANPASAARSSPEELAALCMSSIEKLGPDHWACAASLLVAYYRCRPTGGKLDAFTAAAGCRFLGWLVSRNLPWPSCSVIRTPLGLSMEVSSWLAFPAERGAPEGSPDGRALAARILSDFLLPVFDASGTTIAKVANTGAKVDRLKAWLTTLRTTCGACGCQLASEGGAAPGGGGDKLPVASACGRCKQVRYCSRACQQSDWKARHKSGCLQVKEPLVGNAAWQMLLTFK